VAVEKQNMRDFLIEHYRQVNEHMRESDRKRDVLLSSYLLLVGAVVGVIASLRFDPWVLAAVILGLLLIGCIMAIIVSRFAAWHAEYVNVGIAIHKCFLEGDFDLSKAAQDVKKEGKCPYFRKGGVEFMMMIFVLFLLCIEVTGLVFLVWYWFGWPLWAKILVSLIGSIAIVVDWVAGILLYRYSLHKREDGFPEKSWLILEKKQPNA